MAYTFNPFTGNLDAISVTDLTGYITGSGVANQIGYFASQYVLTSSGNFLYDGSNLRLTDGSVLFDGTTGTTPASGAGSRLMWIPSKKAFRAGSVNSLQWNDYNIGTSSIALGTNCTASGTYSIAIGFGGTASGSSGITIGQATASSASSIGIGNQSIASASQSIAIGTACNASGNQSLAVGYSTKSAGLASLATGYACEVNGITGFVGGHSSVSNGNMSFVHGQQCVTEGDYSQAFGNYAYSRQEGHKAFSVGKFASNLNSSGNAQTVETILRMDFEPYGEDVIATPEPYIVIEDWTVAFDMTFVFRADDGTSAMVTKKLLVVNDGGDASIIVSSGDVMDPNSLIDSLDVFMDGDELFIEFISNYNDDMGVVVSIKTVENGYKKVLT